MPGNAAKTVISERQQKILRTFSRSVTAPTRLRQRASIIILPLSGLLNEDIAVKVGLTYRQVGRWRRRWANAWNRLIDIECCESRTVLRRAIVAVLSDEPRPGAHAKFTSLIGSVAKFTHGGSKSAIAQATSFSSASTPSGPFYGARDTSTDHTFSERSPSRREAIRSASGLTDLQQSRMESPSGTRRARQLISPSTILTPLATLTHRRSLDRSA
jgi:hypothetical protein